MKISQIAIYQSKILLQEPFVISLGLLEAAENIIIVVTTDDGLVGFGECSPFPTIHGESMETCFVVAQPLARALKGRNPLDIEGCAAAMDRVIFGNACVKSAFDMALYDVASQHAQLPLYAFLGGKKDKTIVTDYTVSFGDAKKMSQDALKIKNKGFQIIKVKLGGSHADDVARIAQIRAAVGYDLPIRIDANQGWSVETAVATLRALAAFSIQHCEEPISRRLFAHLPEVRRNSPIPIMADESCCDVQDADWLIANGACDFFNLKLSKSAGIFGAKKIVARAEMADIKIQVGGFLESRLGFTAAAHFALTSKNIVHYDFDTPLMFTEDYVTDGILYKEKGVIEMPDKIGLGASVDENHLESLKKVMV